MREIPRLRRPAKATNILVEAFVLDAYIIDDIKRREEERRRSEDANRPRLHIEVPPESEERKREDEEEDDSGDIVRIQI